MDTPNAINERGDFVGFASLPGSDPNDPILHAFLWTKREGIRDLGTLPGDTTSEAHSINDRGQVVGLSCGEKVARDINNKGEITGRAIDSSTGQLFAYLAVPTRR